MNTTLLEIFAQIRTIGYRAYAPVVIVVAFILVPFQLGCATTPELAPVMDVHQPVASEEPPGFETPPELVASDFIPAELLSGPHHDLNSRVVNDGYTNHYLVLSEYGDFPAAGLLELKNCVQEIEAIAELRDMKRREAYGKGAAAGAKRAALTPVRQVKRYVKDPLHLVLAVPGEAMRTVGVAKDVLKLVRMGSSKAYFKELIGYDDAKKDLAKRLGVDPGSSNPVLQAELNQAAWSYYGGSAPMYLLEEFVPLAPIPRVTLVAGGDSVAEAVDSFSHEVGGKSVATQLRRMGVAKSDRKAFKKHPEYSSRDRKNLVRSLYKLDDARGRDTFVTHALEAESRDEARAMVRHAQTVAVYDAAYDNIVEMTRVDDAVLCYTKGGVVMMPLYADHVAWTESFVRRVDAMAEWQPEVGEVQGREIWVAGQFTPWAQRELEARNVAVHENAIDTLTAVAHELENNKNGFVARIRRNKTGRTLDKLADATEQ